jgi:hypothetical protein
MFKGVQIPIAFGIGVGLVLVGFALLPLILATGSIVTPSLMLHGQFEFAVGLFRTLGICGSVCVLAGLVAAIQCTALASGQRRLGPWDYLVLVPLFSGEVVLGFIYKSILGFHALGASFSVQEAWLFYYFVHILIFGLLMGQVMTILIGPSILSENDAHVYFRSLGIGEASFLQKYIIPKTSSLISFVTLLIFVIVGQQAAFGKLAFHPSQAQHNELWLHVLDRTVRELSAIDPGLTPAFYSFWNILAGVILVVFGVVSAWMLPAILRFFIKGIGRLANRIRVALQFVVQTLLILNLISAFAIPGWSFVFSSAPANGWELPLRGLLLSILFAFVSSIVAVALSSTIWSYSLWAARQTSLLLGGRAYVAYLGFLLALFIPRKAIGMGVLAVVQFLPGIGEIYLAPTMMWLLTHILCILPLTAIYLAAIMSSTTAADGIFIRSHGGSFFDFLTRVIIPRYWKEMAILCGFCLILVALDYPVNQTFYVAFDAQAPSFAEIIVNAIESRRASIPFAAFVVLLTTTGTSALLLMLQQLTTAQFEPRARAQKLLRTAEV